jgi:hypothetical protein
MGFIFAVLGDHLVIASFLYALGCSHELLTLRHREPEVRKKRIPTMNLKNLVIASLGYAKTQTLELPRTLTPRHREERSDVAISGCLE